MCHGGLSDRSVTFARGASAGFAAICVRTRKTKEAAFLYEKGRLIFERRAAAGMVAPSRQLHVI